VVLPPLTANLADLHPPSDDYHVVTMHWPAPPAPFGEQLLDDRAMAVARTRRGQQQFFEQRVIGSAHSLKRIF
jgi:hypothetical protein